MSNSQCGEENQENTYSLRKPSEAEKNNKEEIKEEMEGFDFEAGITEIIARSRKGAEA